MPVKHQLLVALLAAAIGLWLGRCYLSPPASNGPTLTDTLIETNPALRDSLLDALAALGQTRQNAAQKAQEAARWHATARAYADSLKVFEDSSGALRVDATLDDCRRAFWLKAQQAAASGAEAATCRQRADSLDKQVDADSTRIMRLILRVDTLTRQLHVEQVTPRPCRVDLVIAHPKCGPVIGGAVVVGTLFGIVIKR